MEVGTGLRKLLQMVQNDNVFILVHHNHKGGGSNLCRFFRKKTRLHVPKQRNCNGNRGENITLFTKDTYNNYDVVFKEGSFPFADVPTKPFTLTTMRDPLMHHISHLMHVRRGHPEKRVANFETQLKGFVQKQSDFQMKKLLEKRASNNADSVCEMASKKLNMFDFVIPTEWLESGKAILQDLINQSPATHISAESTISPGTRGMQTLKKIKTNLSLQEMQSFLRYDSCDRYLHAQSLMQFKLNQYEHEFLSPNSRLYLSG